MASVHFYDPTGRCNIGSTRKRRRGNGLNSFESSVMFVTKYDGKDRTNGHVLVTLRHRVSDFES
jgi:hypothetical protein